MGLYVVCVGSSRRGSTSGVFARRVGVALVMVEGDDEGGVGDEDGRLRLLLLSKLCLPFVESDDGVGQRCGDPGSLVGILLGRERERTGVR